MKWVKLVIVQLGRFFALFIPYTFAVWTAAWLGAWLFGIDYYASLMGVFVGVLLWSIIDPKIKQHVMRRRFTKDHVIHAYQTLHQEARMAAYLHDAEYQVVACRLLSFEPMAREDLFDFRVRITMQELGLGELPTHVFETKADLLGLTMLVEICAQRLPHTADHLLPVDAILQEGQLIGVGNRALDCAYASL